MKKVEAVFRMEKLEAVTDALDKFCCPGMMITRIEGHGRQKGLTEQFRGREYKVNFLAKVKVEVVVKDSDVAKVMLLIAAAAKTGEIGDGKIFVYPVEDVLRIRTGEKGEGAL